MTDKEIKIRNLAANIFEVNVKKFSPRSVKLFEKFNNNHISDYGEYFDIITESLINENENIQQIIRLCKEKSISEARKTIEGEI